MHGMKAGERYLSPITNALIWHSLNTGIGTITEENVAEVWARISFVEHIYGASLLNSEGPRPITRDDVRKHIGLKTNASFKVESRPSFLKRHAASYLDDQVRGYKASAERAEKATA